MFQADLDELRQQVRDLTNRISRLEDSLAASERSIPSREAVPLALPPDIGILSQVPDATSALPVLGGAFLGLAGAYLLRAIAEYRVLPPRAGFTLGTLYAVAWLLWAARVPVERRLATTLYSLTSVLILSPLLWEATVRFHMITTWEASTILVAFTLIGLAVSWRRDLLVVATISTLAGLGTAGALLIATHDAMPFTLVFLAIAAAVEACACLNHWLGERWLAAAARQSFGPAGHLAGHQSQRPSRRSTRPFRRARCWPRKWRCWPSISPALWFGPSCAASRLPLSRQCQCVLAFVIGLGGAVRLSAGGTHVTSAIGVFALACGAACYTISFIMLERHGSQGRNFYTYSTFGILLVLVGCRMLLNDGAAGIVWSALAVACIGAGGRWARLTLEIHGGIYLVLALALSGALRQSAGFLLGTDFWLDSAHMALWIGVAVAAASYLLAARSAPAIGDGWNFHALRLALAAVLVWEVLGLSAGGLTSIYHGLVGITAGDPYCATIRTGAVTGAAMLLAFAGSRSNLSHLAQLVYPLMLLGAYRLVAVDMHQDRKVALFLSLLFYGAALMAIPRLRRARLNS